MNTLDYILKKFNIVFGRGTPMPIEIPNYGRDNMASLFYELGFKTGIEIGVESGAYSETLVKNNPGLRLFSIDPWRPLPEYHDYRSKEIFAWCAWGESLGYEPKITRALLEKNKEWIND